MQPPIAEKIPHQHTIHNNTIIDDYFWLRDPNWPKVSDPKIIKYLEAENNYAEDYFKSKEHLKNAIFQELKGRIKLDDISPYIQKDNYFYYKKTLSTNNYPIYCRKHKNINNKEEILLNVNILAQDKKFIKVNDVFISPTHRSLAYGVDLNGDERYTIKVLNLITHKYLPDTIPATIGSIVWHKKIPGFFYTTVNDNWRQDKLYFHKLGDNIKNDQLILHEPDSEYFIDIHNSTSEKYLIININGHDNNAVHVLDLEDRKLIPQLIAPKTEKVLYDLQHRNDQFFIKTNLHSENFKLVYCNTTNYAQDAWQDYLHEHKTQYLEDFTITKDYLLLNYKDITTGLTKLKVQDFTTHKIQEIKFFEPSFTAAIYSTNFSMNDIRIDYSSLNTPDIIYQYFFALNKLIPLKIMEIPSGFTSSEYAVERIYATSTDNVKVPISLLYKKSLFKKDSSNPLYLYGYGSYGLSVGANFRNYAITLADRGFVFAIAHIRGGNDLGYSWYTAAKFLTKKRTFFDFIAATEFLIKQQYTKENNIVISGGSAGGMLIGAVLNMQPTLFKAAILHVPFVDVLNTMLDSTLPLTPHEFNEWGNPQNLEYFNYIKSYSPYDNITTQHYPALFVTAGINDPRVGYWEPAKWVAKLRSIKKDQNLLLFKTSMHAGHSGASARFDYLKEIAEDCVFVFTVFGKD